MNVLFHFTCVQFVLSSVYACPETFVTKTGQQGSRSRGQSAHQPDFGDYQHEQDHGEVSLLRARSRETMPRIICLNP
jgi:hypothetical protein